MIRLRYNFIFIFLIFLFSFDLQAQVTRIRGTVTDSHTQEPLPFVNISLKNTGVGTITDKDGNFFIETRIEADTIVVSFVGYKKQKKAIQKYHYQEIKFELEPDMYYLAEVVIKPGENPAHPIFRNILDNKHLHNPERFDTYNYEIYNKIEIGVDNVDDRLKNNPLLRDFRFIFDYVDTSAITGKVFLPFLITESLSDYYYRRSPRLEREIIKAASTSGIENISVSELTGQSYQKINIYENFVRVFEPGFVSPISDYGLFYYNYHLLDSGYVDNKYCYHISFVPRRRQDRTFSGDFWVNDTTFAIKKITMRLAEDVNFNFINDFVAEFEYAQLEDSSWFMKQERLFFDFNLEQQLTGFYVNKTAQYDNIVVNEPIPEDVLKLRDKIVIDSDAIKKDREFWDENRPLPLTTQDENIYKMVDSVQAVPIYQTYEKLVSMFVMDHYEIGLFEIGPYFRIFSFNEIEGNRLRLGGRTSNNFSTDLMISGYGAYGEKDRRFKYGGGILYLFDNNPRFAVFADYKNDIEQLGQSQLALTDDNLFKSLLQRNPNYQLTMVQEANVGVEKEWFQGFNSILTFTHRRIEPNEYVPFRKTLTGVDNIIDEEDSQTTEMGDLKTTEISLNLRLTREEKILRGEFERMSLGTTKPVLNLYFTVGLQDIFKSQFDYAKASFNLEHRVPVSPFGYFRYIVDGGWIFGSVPYPLLELHPGNETYIFYRHAFNMMNYYEFASDKYLSVYLAHHFQGFFLNRIPLVRRLQLREVVSVKGLIGSLDDSHRQVMDFPDGLHSLTKPYIEVSAGIENIFKVIRLDAVWRLSYLDHENIESFGLRTTVQFTF